MTFFQRVTPTDNAAALARALETVAADLAAARGRVAGLEAARGAALLEGGETARRGEAALGEARAEVERAEAMRATLAARHAAAEKRERREALERRLEAVETQCQRAAETIKKRWPKLAGELLEMLEAEAAAEARILGLAGAFMADPEAAEGLRLPGGVKLRYLVADPSGSAMPALPLYQLVQIPPAHCRWTADTGSAWSPGYGRARAAGAE